MPTGDESDAYYSAEAGEADLVFVQAAHANHLLFCKHLDQTSPKIAD